MGLEIGSLGCGHGRCGGRRDAEACFRGTLAHANRVEYGARDGLDRRDRAAGAAGRVCLGLTESPRMGNDDTIMINLAGRIRDRLGRPVNESTSKRFVAIVSSGGSARRTFLPCR